MRTPSIELPPVSDYPPTVHELIERALSDQERLGWKAATRGLLSNSWRDLANVPVFEPTNDQQPGRGDQSMQTISKALHVLARSLWVARNEVLHGDNKEENVRIRSIDDAEMRVIHQHPELLPAWDRHYCAGNIHDLLRKSQSTKRRWLRHMRMVKQHMTQDGQRQATMTSFFLRAPQPTTV